MNVWAVIYHPELFSDDLYEKGLSCIDEASQARVKRFYHRADSCRTLIGRLLVRVMLKERGMAIDPSQFAITKEGKPYIASQVENTPVAYNITHDNNLIAMAYGPGTSHPPAFSIGVDIMKIKIPGRDTLNSFITVVGEQLTRREHDLLSPAVPDSERLKRFFWMWTLKEAYTKALGLGLGFDFRRVEFDVPEKTVRIDGEIPEGWRFSMFTVHDGEELYQGVVAQHIGDMATEILDCTNNKPEWLTIHNATTFLQKALVVLENKESK
ncbi:4'-phosphopantetheinyl transferase [Agrocybe pediades]|nr:4'-phosphopantetheinyl transferase [Agrocybe pediades]